MPGLPDVVVRYFEPPAGDPADASRLRAYAGGVVVTSEHPSPVLARAGTKPDDVALLERHARVVLDIPIETVPDPTRVYEPFDLHYLPFTGLSTLARPGPHVRIWSVPRADELAETSQRPTIDSTRRRVSSPQRSQVRLSAHAIAPTSMRRRSAGSAMSRVTRSASAGTSPHG